MKFTATNSIKLNGTYHQPGATMEFKESDPEAKRLLELGALKHYDPKFAKDYQDKKTTPSPYEEDLTEIKGIGQDLAFALNNLGIRNFEQLAKYPLDRMAQLPGITERNAKAFISKANAKIKARK